MACIWQAAVPLGRIKHRAWPPPNVVSTGRAFTVATSVAGHRRGALDGLTRPMPTLVLLAGPNGAGKTTFIDRFLRQSGRFVFAIGRGGAICPAT